MNVAPSTAAGGTCFTCSAPLASGQRYCLTCGERRADLPAPFRPPEREPELVAAPLISARRSFGAVGTIVLACGVLIGAAVGPALTPTSLASTAGQLIVVSTDAVGAVGTKTSSDGSSGSSSPLSTALAAPTGNVAAPPHRVVNRGGGSAPAPAPAPAPSAPPPSPAKAPTPSQPTTPTTPQAPAANPTVAGTVVHLSHGGHGYAVATKDGQLIALHAAKQEPKLGDKVKTTVKPLDNGTFKQLVPKTTGHADSTTFHGVVTYADLQTGVYTVSAFGVSLLVHVPAPPPPADPAAPPPPPTPVPAVGKLTTVDVKFDAAKVEETKRVDGDPASGDLDLEAIVQAPPDPAAPPDPGHLIVSADDAGESQATLSVKVPPKLDVSKLRKPGTVISALVKLEQDGSFTLTSANDDSAP